VGRAFSLEVGTDIETEIDQLVTAKLGDLTPFYWNTGQARNWDGQSKLIAVESDAKASSIQPPMTHSQKYRKDIREVGTERFRVQ